MDKPLTEILSDGTLVDNTVHTAQDGVFRAGRHGAQVNIRRQGRGWTHPWTGWPVMQQAAALNTQDSKVVLRVPEPEADYEHNTEDPFISLGGPDPLNFTLATGNLIGCVTSGDYQLRVSSRFGDEFLKYIIADADGFAELPDHGGMDSGGYEWLLHYLWHVKLLKALRLGLPKTYETRTQTLPQLRGRLDPVDYFQNNSLGQYRCTYREHSYDNDATRLVARTLEHLGSEGFLRGSQALQQTFQAATEGRHHALEKLLAARPVRNPYYTDYNPVMALSKQILRRELSDFGSPSRTSAFFFDVSMLFEFFIRKLLKRAGVTFHGKNAVQWRIPTGLLDGRTQRSLIPDLVFDLHGSTYVFDVKYKSFPFSEGVSREDLFQLHTYIGQAANRQPVAGCGFIYPIRESRWQHHGLEARSGILSTTITQGGRAVPFHVVFLKIPEQGDITREAWPSVFRTTFKDFTAQFARTFLEQISCGHPAGTR